MTSSTKTVLSWAAASRAARPPGSSRLPACRSSLHEMRPVRGTERISTGKPRGIGLLEFFRSDDAANNAVGLLHEEMRRANSLILRAADAHKLPAGGALAVDRHGLFPPCRRACSPIRWSTLRREESPVAAGRLGQRDRRHRTLTSPALAEASASRAPGVARLLRRHRADRFISRASISIAWKQSRYDKAGRPATAPTISTAR